MLLLSSTLHSLENLVIARCFPDFSAYLVEIFVDKVSQIRTIREYSENITSQNFQLYGTAFKLVNRINRKSIKKTMGREVLINTSAVT